MANYEQDTMLNGNNRFDANRYHVMNRNGRHWNWQNPKTWQEFRAAGQEAHGTVDEKMPTARVKLAHDSIMRKSTGESVI